MPDDQHGSEIPSAGDVTVSPDEHGYTVGRVTLDGRTIVPVSAGLRWPLALSRAHRYSRAERSRVFAKRAGREFELVDEYRLWLDANRVWHAHVEDVVRKQAPAKPGVYVLRAVLPVYVGETEDLRERLLYHLAHPGECERRMGRLEFTVQEFVSADLRVRRAADLLSWWMPPCNQTT